MSRQAMMISVPDNAEGSHNIFRDPRIRSVPWRDLQRVSPAESLGELLLPSFWLTLSLLVATTGRYELALPFSFLFFLTGLRVVHNGFHSALGLSRAGNNAVLWVMSVLMLGSMHAVRFNHQRHHNPKPGQVDVEAQSAEMPGWRALLFGPAFPVLLTCNALRHGSGRLRTTIAGELLLNVVWILWVFGAQSAAALRYHVLAMAVGQCLTAFFAVWTVHRGCDRTHFIARTLRDRIRNRITFNMFLHLEHHLFPAVPTCHLPELSRRIDLAAPELRSKLVF